MAESDRRRQPRKPSLFDSILPLVVLVALIAGALALFGLDALNGPIPAALVSLACFALNAGLLRYLNRFA